MPWARLDDGFHDHPKVDGLSLAAVGLFTLCLTWANRHMATAPIPGHVPVSRVKKLAGSKAKILVKELTTPIAGKEHGLWEIVDDGYVIHDFKEYLAKQRDPEERSAAGRKGARSRWQVAKETDSNLPSEPMASSHEVDSNHVANGMANDGSRASAPAYPSRPDPYPNNSPTVGESLNAPSEPTTIALTGATTAQKLIGAWIDNCRQRPPDRVIGQTARLVAEMLAENIDPDHIAAGLAAWTTKGLAPSVLPSVVHEVMNSRPPTPRGQQATNDLFDRAAQRMGVAP